MSYEYKCVGAPERPKKQRRVRGRSDRVALAMQEVIAAEAVDGWEYMRTDLVPVEEKNSLFSRAHEVHRAVLVFRRELEPEPRVIPGRRGAGSETAAWPEAPEQPARSGELRIPLSAERDEPKPARAGREEHRAEAQRAGKQEPPAPGRSTRPPSGLG